MISCTLALCGERVILDARHDQISIIDIFEEINSQGFPILIPSVSCLFLLRREENDPYQFDFHLSVKLNTEQLFRSSAEADFGENDTTRLILTIHGVPVPNPGKLTFELEHEDMVVGKCEVEVKSIDTQPQMDISEPANASKV